MDDGTHKIVRENTPIGIPRSFASQISAIVPPTFVIGAEEAVPAIYEGDNVSGCGFQSQVLLTSRQMSIVSMF